MFMGLGVTVITRLHSWESNLHYKNKLSGEINASCLTIRYNINEKKSQENVHNTFSTLKLGDITAKHCDTLVLKMVKASVPHPEGTVCMSAFCHFLSHVFFTFELTRRGWKYKYLCQLSTAKTTDVWSNFLSQSTVTDSQETLQVRSLTQKTWQSIGKAV